MDTIDTQFFKIYFLNHKINDDVWYCLITILLLIFLILVLYFWEKYMPFVNAFSHDSEHRIGSPLQSCINIPDSETIVKKPVWLSLEVDSAKLY